MMQLEYDPRGDIAYIHMVLSATTTVDHTERVGGDDEYERGIDYSADGQVIGYEFMNASQGLDLQALPERDRIAAFIASIAGLNVIQKAS
jgi:uncharacterized protein YuzE